MSNHKDYQHEGLPSSDIFTYIKKCFGSISAGWGVFSYVPCIWIYSQERSSFGGKTARKASIINAFQTDQITLGRWLWWPCHGGVSLTPEQVRNQHFATFNWKTYTMLLGFVQCSHVHHFSLSEASSEEGGFIVNIFRIQPFGPVLNLSLLRKGKLLFLSLDAEGHLDQQSMWHRPWGGLLPAEGGQSSWHYPCSATHIHDQQRCQKIIIKSISTILSNFMVSLWHLGSYWEDTRRLFVFLSCVGSFVRVWLCFLFFPKLPLGLQAANHHTLLFIVMEVKIISRVEHNFRWRQLRVIELSSCAAASPKPSCCPIIFLGDCFL